MPLLHISPSFARTPVPLLDMIGRDLFPSRQVPSAVRGKWYVHNAAATIGSDALLVTAPFSHAHHSTVDDEIERRCFACSISIHKGRRRGTRSADHTGPSAKDWNANAPSNAIARTPPPCRPVTFCLHAFELLSQHAGLSRTTSEDVM